jgi:hypothetical protein
MNRKIAESLLAEELASIRQMGYHKLAALLGSDPLTKEITGPDGIRYQVEVSLRRDVGENNPIRVIASIDDGKGLSGYVPLTTLEVVRLEPS